MKLAVWYHCKLYGDGIPSEDFAVGIMLGQMQALKSSGLSAAASEFHLGINGDSGMGLLALSLVPDNTAPILHLHGSSAKSELLTTAALRAWLPGHEDWFVLYHHIKGVTHPGEASYDRWRWRMENACVNNWQRCVNDLSRGYDAVGCHWLTPERFPGSVTSPFFGGTFWWATAKYLAQLPPLPEASWQNRFEAESWIGRRRPYPKVRDYHPGWP